jgi:hypothetical protein
MAQILLKSAEHEIMPETRHDANMPARARPTALGAGQEVLLCDPSERRHRA